MLRLASRWSRAAEPPLRAVETALGRARRRIVTAMEAQGVTVVGTASGVRMSGRGLFARRRREADLQWPGELP